MECTIINPALSLLMKHLVIGVVNRGYNMFIRNMGGMANSADPYQVWVCTVCAYTSALICGAIVVL